MRKHRLVRKKQLAQSQMLRMNQLLMVISTVAAVQLLWRHVHPLLAGLSLLLNFAHRSHDFANTMAVLGGGHALRLLLGGESPGGG